jgi:hypothetical protein
MAILGADIAALRGLATMLTSRARKIEATKNKLTVLIVDLPWVGADRDAFVRAWNEIHQPNLMRLIDDMSDASGQAARHANAQESASRVDG